MDDMQKSDAGSLKTEVIAARVREDERYRVEDVDVIRLVRLHIHETSTAVVFQNGERLFALIVAVQNVRRLGWKECRALRDVMEIASRGARVTNESFIESFKQLRHRYAGADKPHFKHGHFIGFLCPGVGGFHRSSDGQIESLGLSFDGDGDLVFSAKTFDGCAYSVCIELAANDDRLYELECKALRELLGALETGNHLTADHFRAAMYIVERDYNFLNVTEAADGRHLKASVLPSPVKNRSENDQALYAAYRRVAGASSASSSSDTLAGPKNNPIQDPPTGASIQSPYPHLTYRQSEPIATGGYADVYRGDYVTPSGAVKDVAVKVLKQNVPSDTFRMEVTLLMKLNHPNVIGVEYFYENPRRAIVMPFIDGPNLQTYLRENGPMPRDRACRFVGAIADGLAHLHKNGVVHRDIKSQNIMMTSDGAPVIVDLGLGGDLGIPHLPALGGTKRPGRVNLENIQDSRRSERMEGTLPWLSPEMFRSQEWSPKSDVYAIGIVLWEVLSGKIPYAGTVNSPQEFMIKVLTGTRPDLSAVAGAGEDLIELLKKCWHAEPNDRPSMRRVYDILTQHDPFVIFNKVDQNGDGQLSLAEFSQFIKAYSASDLPQDVNAIFNAIDSDKNGAISFDEFEAFWADVELSGLENVLRDYSAQIEATDSVLRRVQTAAV